MSKAIEIDELINIFPIILASQFNMLKKHSNDVINVNYFKKMIILSAKTVQARSILSEKALTNQIILRDVLQPADQASQTRPAEPANRRLDSYTMVYSK